MAIFIYCCTVVVSCTRRFRSEYIVRLESNQNLESNGNREV